MKKLLLAALVATGAVLPGGMALADHCLPTAENPIPDPNCHWTEADCGFNTIAQEQTTGGQDTFTGAAYGYAVGATDESLTVRCYVRVDGNEVDSTDPGTGTGFATTSGQVTFTALDTQDVDLCVEVNGVTTDCDETTTTQIPPQEVIDLTALPDFLLCPILASFAGDHVPGVLSINEQGDVDVLDGGFWDCPPYGS